MLQSSTPCLEDLLAWLATGACYDLKQATVRPDHVRERHDTDAFLVWRAFASGPTVKSATIPLPADSLVLLEGAGVHFEDVTFSGGNLVCTGSFLTGTFTACTFRDCSLYAVHGATLTLRDCHVTDSPQGIVAHGAGTAVTATDCTFSGCVSTLIAEADACIHAASSSIEATKVAAVINGACSHVALNGVHMHGAHGQTAVMIQAGTACIRRCEISRFQDGVIAQLAASAVEMHETHARGRRVGVMLIRHARGTLRDVAFAYVAKSGKEWGSSSAVQVGGMGAALAGGRVQLERCSAACPESPCVQVLERAGAALRLCSLECGMVGVQMTAPNARAVLSRCAGRCGDGACWAIEAGVTARLSGCSFESARSVCKAAGGGKIAAVDCELRGASTPQPDGLVSALEGGEVWLLRCSVRDGAGGVHVSMGHATVVDTAIADMTPVLRPGCVEKRPLMNDLLMLGTAYACLGGSLVVRGGSARGCLVAAFVDVDRDYGGVPAACAVRFDGVEFQGCLNGVHVLRSRAEDSVEIAGCTFGRERYAGPRSAAGRIASPMFDTHVSQPSAVYLPAAHSVTVSRCTFECTTPAILANKLGTSLQISDCAFRQDGAKGVVSVDVSVPTCITACTFAGAKAYVVVTGSCTVSDCEFAPGASSAVYVCGAEHVDVRRCRFEDCRQGVTVAKDPDGRWRRRTVNFVVVDCEFEDVKEALTVEDVGCRGVAEGLSITGGDVGCTAGIATAQQRAVLFLMTCKFRDLGTGLLFHKAGVDASVRECEFERCGIGVAARGSASARMHECKVRACETGVIVGDDVGGEETAYRCEVCGCGAGTAAVKAWRARRDADRKGAVAAEGQGAGGAQCVHEGAVACAVLEDLRVDGCTAVAVDVTAGGHVIAADLSVRGSAVGFRECFVEERNVFSRCRVVRSADDGATDHAVVCQQLTCEGDRVRRVSAQGMDGVHVK